MSKVNRILAALNILFFFTFGVLSVSFAARGPLSPGLYRHLKSHGSPEGQLAQVDRTTLKRAAPIEEDRDMLFEEESERASSSNDTLVVKKSAEASFRNSQSYSTSRTIFAPKVPRNIFQSVLIL